MTLREFAKLVGVSHPAIVKACSGGRLNRSVKRDARGRVVSIDPELGMAEWHRRRSRLSPVQRGDGCPASAGDLAEVVRRLSELMAADLDEEKRLVLELVPHAVEGEREALREARGRAPSAAELAAAFRLEPFDEDAGLELLVELHGIVEGGTCDGTAIEPARRAGRQAVLGSRREAAES